MITKAQALTAQEFHAGECTLTVGPRGGEARMAEVWRRNGATKVWVRSPERWVVPVKFGLYRFSEIHSSDAEGWHVPSECPVLRGEVRTLVGPLGVVLKLDRREINLADPGAGCPAMVECDQGRAGSTYWTATETGECLGYGAGRPVPLTPRQWVWLKHQADAMNDFLYPTTVTEGV